MQKPSEIDFLSWVLQLNIAMAEFGQEIIRRCRGENVLIHAHDWLVSYAAREIKNTLEVPLISTIHATESGRNQGRIYNQMQQSIHQLEQELIDCSDHIICCS
jgi:1,4-alpha-glucan branching enzyme